MSREPGRIRRDQGGGAGQVVLCVPPMLKAKWCSLVCGTRWVEAAFEELIGSLGSGGRAIVFLRG